MCIICPQRFQQRSRTVSFLAQYYTSLVWCGRAARIIYAVWSGTAWQGSAKRGYELLIHANKHILALNVLPTPGTVFFFYYHATVFKWSEDGVSQLSIHIIILFTLAEFGKRPFIGHEHIIKSACHLFHLSFKFENFIAITNSRSGCIVFLYKILL